MNLTSEQRGLLLQRAESGRLTAGELARARDAGALQPTVSEWRDLLERVLAFGGALLLTAALVFFLAYNWDALHRFARLGLALGALAACCAAAMWAAAGRGAGWRAALFGASVATGAVLALVGQTYQTGADMWQLFAAWAALMTPFALAARSAASWALWLVLANLALVRAFSQSVWWGFFDALGDAQALLAIAAFNLIVLVVFEGLGLRLLANPRRWLQRLAALGVLAPLCAGGVLGWWEHEFRVVAASFSVVAGAMAFAYHRWRRDLPILALTVYGGIAVLTGGVIKALRVESFFSLNLVGLFVIATSAGAGVWLARLHRQAASTEATAGRDQVEDALGAPSPWWLSALQTLAAWVASLLILASFMLPLALVGERALLRAIAGAVLCGVAIALFRRERLFTTQMALAFSLAGQALLVSATGAGWSAFFDAGRQWAAAGLLAAAAMAWPRTSPLHRSLCALLMALHGAALIGVGVGLEVLAAALAALVAALWMTRSRWADTGQGALIAALVRGGTLAALALPGFIGAARGLQGSDAWRIVLWSGGIGEADGVFVLRVGVLSIAAGVLFALSVARLTAAAGSRRRALAVAAAVALAVLSQPAPGLLVAASLFLACFRGGHRGFAALALIAAVAYVGDHYYRLDTSLLMKSGLMAASGLVLLALRRLWPAAAGVGVGTALEGAPDRGAAQASRAPMPSWLRASPAAAFLLVAGVTAHAVVDFERVLAAGRIVLIELAPVDPRSLMQGDYMALRFAPDDGLPRRTEGGAAPPPRFAYLEVDEEGRARLAGVGESLPAPAGAIGLRIRMRDGAPSVGPNAFFFQEGQAAGLAGARWGEFRVAADGMALLTHLRDADLQRLGETAR